MPIENIETTRLQNWGVRHTAIAILDLYERNPSIFSSANRPYLTATLKSIAEDPEAFRSHGYSFTDMRYCDFEKDKKGKLKRCRAYYSTPPYGYKKKRSDGDGTAG